jgi:hypothetical protein
MPQAWAFELEAACTPSSGRMRCDLSLSLSLTLSRSLSLARARARSLSRARALSCDLSPTPRTDADAKADTGCADAAPGTLTWTCGAAGATTVTNGDVAPYSAAGVLRVGKISQKC